MSDLISEICTATKYEAFLESSHVTDFKDRFENILELKAYAKSVAEDNPDGIPGLSNDIDAEGREIGWDDEEGDDSGFANLENTFE